MKYVQVGFTAARDPLTGGFLPAVPLYICMDDARAQEQEQHIVQTFAQLLKLHNPFKEYVEQCERENAQKQAEEEKTETDQESDISLDGLDPDRLRQVAEEIRREAVG